MKFTLYHADAFTNRMFHGNPAAVIPLEKWIDDELMQKIAAENNLSETAFFVPSKINGVDYDLRWFTPEVEINLCGHATLATAFILFRYMNFRNSKIVFSCKSGKLEVENNGDVYRMDFPAWSPQKTDDYPAELQKALGVDEIVGVYKQRDLLVELQNEEAVKKCNPDFSLLKALGEKVIITAPGTGDVDFVSRFFAPSAGINEDPVTGSAHSQLIPFWAEKLGKKKMFAKQISSRGGELQCGMWGDRVTMAGQCVFYMKGEITL
jgi:PhzF family phenazine biosynthesis protein